MLFSISLIDNNLGVNAGLKKAKYSTVDGTSFFYLLEQQHESEK